MIAVIGCIVCARRSLFSVAPRRHSNRPRHLLGFVTVVVKTAEVASEVIITEQPPSHCAMASTRRR